MLKQLIQQIIEHNLFISFHDKHPSAFLAHVFIQDQTIQAGYYDASAERMTTFVVSGDRVDRIEDQEVLKTDGTILPLDIDRVTLQPPGARKVFSDTLKQHYPKEQPTQTFIILQQSTDGPYYNITALTASIKTINIKISATDGTVLKHSCEALVRM
ncbi:hypothetical protein HY490_03845 [Candidatus Woesearchaeota archaeon]|nr:hypothetical protein [Candidatus Woesearchaeota archaeon]